MLPQKQSNDFLDEVWQGSTTPGTRPLQRRVQWLCEELATPIRDVCASNLIFMRSRFERDARFPEAAHLCWPIHETVLSIVRPRLILTHGGNVFRYVMERLGSTAQNPVESIPSGHGQWVCRQVEVELDGRRVRIFGFPHLSRYDPRRSKDAVAKLARSLRNF